MNEVVFGHRALPWRLPEMEVSYRWHRMRSPAQSMPEAVIWGLESPLAGLGLRDIVYPGDRVVLVVDNNLPLVQVLLPIVCKLLVNSGVNIRDVQILQGSCEGDCVLDPRGWLPAEYRQVGWSEHQAWHEPAQRMQSCGYLGTTAHGERIYLHRALLDADVIIPLIRAGYDPLTGYRRLGSIIYPWLSHRQAVERTFGGCHPELDPEDAHAWQQTLEEIAWLLGIHTAVCVVPHSDPYSVTAVLSGDAQTVMQEAQTLLDSQWNVQCDQRCEALIALAAVGETETSWSELGEIARLARRLVVRGGRVVILSDVSFVPRTFLQRVTSSLATAPQEILEKLRSKREAALWPLQEWLELVSWAEVSLFSALKPQETRQLFAHPLSTSDELSQILSGCRECLVVPAAQYAFGKVC